MAEAAGATSVTTATLPRTSIVESPPSPTNTVLPCASATALPVGVISVQKPTARPPIFTELLTVEMRVRRMFHHWNQLPSGAPGFTPILRISSATHIDATISSSEPASRPRMASPAMLYMSRLRSASLMSAIAAGGRVAALCAPRTAAGVAKASQEAASARRGRIVVILRKGSEKRTAKSGQRFTATRGGSDVVQQRMITHFQTNVATAPAGKV